MARINPFWTCMMVGVGVCRKFSYRFSLWSKKPSAPLLVCGTLINVEGIFSLFYGGGFGRKPFLTGYEWLLSSGDGTHAPQPLFSSYIQHISCLHSLPPFITNSHIQQWSPFITGRDFFYKKERKQKLPLTHSASAEILHFFWLHFGPLHSKLIKSSHLNQMMIIIKPN